MPFVSNCRAIKCLNALNCTFCESAAFKKRLNGASEAGTTGLKPDPGLSHRVETIDVYPQN